MIAGEYQHVALPGQVMNAVVAIIQLIAYSTQLVVLMATTKGVVMFFILMNTQIYTIGVHYE